MSPQAKLWPHRMNTAPSVSLYTSGFVFVQVRICLDNDIFPLRSLFPADNGSILSSEAITDSATSTDNNYVYMGTHIRAFLLAHFAVGLHGRALVGFLRVALLSSPVSSVSLPIRTGAFQTSPNPQSPSPHSHPHW